MAREKQVYSTDKIAHLWMHQTQSSARNRGSGNFYFNGDTIYSYRDSFPIARHCVRKDGTKYILFTDHTYSVTTSGHINEVRHAIHGNGIPVFEVLNPSAPPERELVRYANRIELLTEQFKLGRNIVSRTKTAGLIRSVVDNANKLATFIKSRKRFKVPAILEASKDEIKAYQNRKAIADRKREAKREEEYRLATIEREKRIKEANERFPEIADQWRRGVITDREFRTAEALRDVGWYDRPTLLRIVVDTNDDGRIVQIVETSRGADFPIAHALRVLPLVERILERGEEWHANGSTIHLGHYKLESISADGTIKAGCHTILKDEVLRLIAELKTINPSEVQNVETV